HFMLFCKLRKGCLIVAKKSKGGIKNPIQIGSSGICTRNWNWHNGLSLEIRLTEPDVFNDIIFSQWQG
ncbi:hypothetical protein KA005_23610, partial [bacterium]|nr:hypothetical protein [bacterium]